LSRYFRTDEGARRLREAERELEAKRARRGEQRPSAQLETASEPSRSTRSGRRGLPAFATEAERLAYYERHRPRF
jgi:hypothetical protein